MNFEGFYLASKSHELSPSSGAGHTPPRNVPVNPRLSLFDAYSAIFEDEEALEYSFELFLEDLESFELAEAGVMSYSEAVLVMQTMQ